MYVTFEQWFNALVQHARDDDNEGLINVEDPDSYHEYYEDGDTPEQAYYTELDASEDVM